MKIFYDGIIYGHYSSRPGGISNFFDHLISNVSCYYNCLLTSSRPSHLPHPKGPKLYIQRNNFKISPGRINNKLEKLCFTMRADLFRPHVIHSTYYGNPTIVFSRAPIIYTVYDMILEKWASDLDPSGVLIKEKRKSLERAAALPCISNATRNDLIDLYPHLKSKTSVIYLAGQPKYEAKKNQHFNHGLALDPYILYVGARSSYKNFKRFVSVFSRVSIQFSKLRLKVAGSPWSTDERIHIQSLGIENKIDIYSSIEDVDLYELYSHSTAFVYPSLYEGFGIPPLEAMSLGTPVLASNTSSIPEITGDAALLFNPWSESEIYNAIIKILTDRALREELIKKGKRRCLQFSWEKTSAEYIELYHNVVRKSKWK